MKISPLLLLAGAAAAASVPVWPLQYSATGWITLPYANITEEFRTYYDGVIGRQYIDYYGGMDSYLYRVDLNASYESTPQGNLMVCTPTLNQTTSLTTFLPDTTNYTFIEYTLITLPNGFPKSVAWWQTQVQGGNRINTYDLYVDSNNSAPVRFHMLGYDIVLGSHFDEYQFDYLTFVSGANAFPTGIFNVPDCTGSPNSVGNPEMGVELIRECIPSSPEAMAPQSPTNDPKYAEFMAKYGKVYSDPAELSQRHARFIRARRLINSHNRKARAEKRSLRLAMNPFGDATPAEMNMRMGRRADGSSVKKDRLAKGFTSNGAHSVHPAPPASALADLPASIDWRLVGAVEPVVDQGICGSCWSHGATATISGSYFLKYGKLLVFSKQELVDCSWPFGNFGCDGGEDYFGYQWIMQNGGIATRDDYGPYLMANGWCTANTTQSTAQLTGYVNVTSGSETALMDALATIGPISVSVDAALDTFTFYSSGIYDDPNCKSDLADLDHTVTLVAYGTDYITGTDYWVIKNSWSTHYGVDGYITIARDSRNICGVTTAPTYTLLA